MSVEMIAVVVTGALTLIGMFVNLGRIVSVLKESSDVLVAFSSMLADGKVDPAEIEALKKEIEDLKKALKKKN